MRGARSWRYDPDLNSTYQEFAVHYGMRVLPARPYKPRDKAKVESGVQVVQRWIVAALHSDSACRDRPRCQMGAFSVEPSFLYLLRLVAFQFAQCARWAAAIGLRAVADSERRFLGRPNSLAAFPPRFPRLL